MPTKLWADIFKPLSWIWDKILWCFKKLWGLVTGTVAANSAWGKIGKVFGKFVTKFTESRAWKAVVRSGLFKFCKKWGPKILAKATKFGGKLASVVGWVMLVQDVKDVAELSACLGTAFTANGDAKKMPTFCDGAATKAIVKHALTAAGQGAAAGELLNGDEYEEQDNVVTTDGAWPIEDEQDPEAARKSWQDGITIYENNT